jgi:maleate cis-trans isomerase
MTDYISKLKPRFRYGAIHPRAHEDPVRNSSYQLYHVVPLDVIEISTGLGLEDYTTEKVEKAAQNFWSCVERLAKEKVDLIIFSGAPISAALGRPRVVEMLRQTKEKTGIPADAPLEALIAALKHLGIAKVSVASRWADKVNDSIKRYLADAGIEVVHTTKRNQWASEAFGMTIEEGLKTALEVGREAAADAPGAEGIFVAGGAAMSLHVIPAVEDEFRKPTFTNMSAEVWNDLIRPGIIPPVEGWGCLLANRSRP